MNNREKELQKVNLNWYPGHMAKAKREIIEDMKLIDVVIEVLDARIPVSSQNPDMKEITKKKKKIVLLNKYDLADENETKRWKEYFSRQGIPAVLIDANQGKGMKQVIDMIEVVMKDEIEEEKKKGRIRKNN